MPTYGFGYLQMKDKRAKGQASTSEFLSQDIGLVTDRSQIINPNDVVNPDNYGLGRRERLRYESDLAQAKLYAEQQEAAYQEWYDSPEQQAARQREAGLNPDLMGVEQSQSSDVTQADSSPMANIPGNEQLFFNAFESFTGLIGSLSSVANLATAFTSLPGIRTANDNLVKQGELLDAQKTAQGFLNEAYELSNIQNLSALVANDVSALYSTALLNDPSLNIDEFFANDDNFASLAPIYSSNPRYSAILANSRKAVMDHLKSAASSQKELASDQFDYGKILNNPLFNQDQKIMASQLGPYMQAMFDMDMAEAKFNTAFSQWMTERQALLDAAASAGSINAEADYNEQYYSAVDAKLAAAAQDYYNQAQQSAFKMQREINKNYLATYKADPNGYNGWRAAYLFSSNGGYSWSDYFLANSQDRFNKLLHYNIQQARWNARNAEAQPWVDVAGSIVHGATSMVGIGMMSGAFRSKPGRIGF